ncbi:MAG: c-type cytochrome [Gammaproteobacteria bacterium]|nr:c-type cytochrome [Gammaproteobacteria bacterium]
MKIIQSFLALTFIFASHLAQANNDVEEGRQLYKTYCSACHGASGGMDMNKRVAPPIIAVRMHYIGSYPDEMSFVAAVADWVEQPDTSNSLMRGAIRKFNIMPPVSVAREDVQKIAAYIYQGNIDKPTGFDEHFEEMHGKRGMNRGM